MFLLLRTASYIAIAAVLMHLSSRHTLTKSTPPLDRPIAPCLSYDRGGAYSRKHRQEKA